MITTEGWLLLDDIGQVPTYILTINAKFRRTRWIYLHQPRVPIGYVAHVLVFQNLTKLILYTWTPLDS
jgi:hypothetical protein